MKERPILFSGEMVRAALDDLKRQTRRTNGLEEINEFPDHWKFDRCFEDDGTYAFTYTEGEFQGELIKCPYGKIGDRLYVRENWGTHRLYDAIKPSNLKDRSELKDGIWYEADIYKKEKSIWMGKTRPNIFLPKRFSRITLEITNIRVERLNDISEEDAYAEGIQPQCRTPKEAFAVLWNQIYGSWEKNPWVWVVEFKVVKP